MKNNTGKKKQARTPIKLEAFVNSELQRRDWFCYINPAMRLTVEIERKLAVAISKDTGLGEMDCFQALAHLMKNNLETLQGILGDYKMLEVHLTTPARRAVHLFSAEGRLFVSSTPILPYAGGVRTPKK